MNNIQIHINPTSKKISLKKGENLTYVAIFKETNSEPIKLNFEFKEEDSALTFLALIIGKNSQEINLQTRSIHTVPNTKAQYFIKSIQSDESSVNCQGSLEINKKAQQTTCYLSHKTLLLSNKAKTTTIPALDINANEIKAGHEATISTLDEDMLFYIQSRGLNKKRAKTMLKDGFIKDLIEKIPDETQRVKIENIINAK